MPPNQPPLELDVIVTPLSSDKIRVALLGCGMMGQEHISYISGYPNLRIDYLCDPHEPSLSKAVKVLQDFDADTIDHLPILLDDPSDLLQRAHEIDLLVICSPNYLHTDTLVQWIDKNVTILVEKPVAVSEEQLNTLRALQQTHPDARIWVAMEYRYIPAIAKLLQHLPEIGDIKLVTIRENRYPFLHKIGKWNRDKTKTGDTLVEKCCHFWDLFRLITGQETEGSKMRSIVQRGLNYGEEEQLHEVPIIDAAYVILPFAKEQETGADPVNMKIKTTTQTLGCLELCMYAEGSRHQEEVIVTGTKGRLEAYLPENKVYLFKRPSHEQWIDRSVPPPRCEPEIFDCYNVADVHHIHQVDLPTHTGYHYSSTSVEWYYLLQAMMDYQETGVWKPHVSLEDGIRAVEMGLQATRVIVNELRNRE